MNSDGESLDSNVELGKCECWFHSTKVNEDLTTGGQVNIDVDVRGGSGEDSKVSFTRLNLNDVDDDDTFVEVKLWMNVGFECYEVKDL